MGLTIAVCVKPVPVRTHLDPVTGRLDRAGAHRMNPVDENAVEAALSVLDAVPGSEVVVVSVAPGRLAESVRPALAMGADRALCVSAPELEGADLLGVSSALASVLADVRPDLVVFGSWSSDGYGAMLWAAVGERLGIPVASRAVAFALNADRLTVTRQIEHGLQVVEVELPLRRATTMGLDATASVTPPRDPSFNDVIAGKKKPIDQVVPTLGEATSGTSVLSIEAAPARAGGTVIEDDGQAHEQLVDFLAQRGLL